MAHIFDRVEQFPYPTETERLGRYSHNSRLLESKHYEAFAIKAEDNFSRQYQRLRYVVANYMALVAKVNADMLFGEEIKVSTKDENVQSWLEGFYQKNALRTQLFESAISNAALGDAVLKLRVEDGEIIVEDTNPAIYFPHLDSMNARQKPEVEEIAFTQEIGEDKYLVRELHRPGVIETLVFELYEDGTIGPEVDVNTFNSITGSDLVAFEETGVESNLIFHIPNFRTQGNKQYFGTSDFVGLEELQFELNNRLTKVANILDKHSDPILAVPEGVLDEAGNVRREAFHMIEVGQDGEAPEYIVWNANLEAAFNQIDKLVEFLFMTSEISPDVLGMGQGQAESGRALKLRMIRTLAKRNRKRLYYEQALKEMLFTAQELAEANGFTVDGEKLKGTPEMPEITWSDGVVNDAVEETEVSIAQNEAGLKSRKTAIQDLFGYTEERAQEEIDAMKEEDADFTSITDRTVV